MRRLLYLAIPVFTAATVLILASPPVYAQAADHGSMAGCACCQKSGTGDAAMNHGAATDAMPMAPDAAGGCCGSMAKDMAMNKADSSAPADHAAMNHEAGGCCGTMAMDHSAMADNKPMDHAAGGCCANMAMNHGAAADAKPMAQGAGCCAGMHMEHDTAPANAMPMMSSGCTVPEDAK